MLQVGSKTATPPQHIASVNTPIMSHDKDQQLLSRRALHSLLAVNFFIETNRMEYATSQARTYRHTAEGILHSHV